ncbi:hypothetical protein BDF22DRAFT_744476 [Syncephalis plumigaleata]|nr:hypothetical protein BDF22DRAFT_744476 [Syncephalis plumigaleata]
MPNIANNRSIIKGWEQYAERLWGIPLYPTGEMESIDYIMENPNSIADMRTRLSGFYAQLVPNIFILYMFSSNLIEALKLVRQRPRAASSWFCTLPALLGVVFGLFMILSMFPVGATCRRFSWYANVCLLVSAICNSSIVLQKAYVVQNRKQWMLLVGIGLMLPQIGYVYCAWVYSIMTLDPLLGCVFNYPTFLPFYWFGAEMPLNFLFSIVFARVAYRQYSMFGSEAWKQLARDGIQTMLYAVFCNIFCIIMIVFEVGGNFSQMFFLLNWLLIYHCTRMRTIHKHSSLGDSNT